MRARRREINIINMSLLDILCGALGAFCFMMLVALPYYKPPGSSPELKKAQEETARLMHDVEQMKDRMPDQKSVEEMERLMRELEAQIKTLQGQVNILTAEKDELNGKLDQAIAAKDQAEAKANQLAAEKQQLQAQADQLAADKAALQVQLQQLAAEKEQLLSDNQKLVAKNQELAAANDELKKQFQLTRIFSVVARADGAFSDLEFLFTFKRESETPDGHERFKDWLRGSYNTQNEFSTLLSGRGTAVEAKYFGKVGTHHVLYLKTGVIPERQSSLIVDSILLADFRLLTRLPRVTLTPERPWTMLGTIVIESNGVPSFKEATSAERDAEWQAVTQSTPPPTATPTPTPSEASLKAAAEARAKNRAVRDKFTRLLHLRPSDSGENDAEILSLADELIKALPPGDMMRRQAEDMRERTLESQKRRDLASPRPSASSEVTPPPRPARPEFSATPVPSATP